MSSVHGLDNTELMRFLKERSYLGDLTTEGKLIKIDIK
jgi:hypothetical protein